MASGVYKMATTVQGADGQDIDRSYVVSQFRDAGSSLAELVEGYKARADGKLEVDDPGATKLLSTKDNLSELLKKFEQQLPQLHKTIQGELKEYLSLVEVRNKAVMNYNASVQLLATAYADCKFYKQRADELGDKALSIDKQAPSVRLWLK